MTAQQLFEKNPRLAEESASEYIDRILKLPGHKLKRSYLRKKYYVLYGTGSLNLEADEIEIINIYRELRRQLGKPKSEEFGETLTVSSTRARTPESLTKECKIDAAIWDLQKFEPGAWETSMKVKLNVEKENEGKKERISATLPLRLENRKTIGIFKKRTAIIDYDKFRRELIEDVKKYSPAIALKHKKTTGKNLLELPITDPHLGALAWGPETGGKNFNVRIIINKVKESFSDLLKRATTNNRIDHIVIPINGDFFNSDKDYPFGSTTKGTPQENDERWQKTFRRGRQLIMELLTTCAKIANVTVIIIPGNHDFQKLFYLGEVLEAKYENDLNITVDNNPTTRKYFRWGSVLLGFTHGKDEGEKRLSYLMQQERRQDWGETKFNEWHLGHVHHDKQVSFISTEDQHGLTLRYLRTLKELDSYESQRGYGGMKGSSAFIWNNETGLKDQLFYND